MKKAEDEKTAVSKPVRRVKKKVDASLPVEDDRLMLENLRETSNCFEKLSHTLDAHVLKTASIASHIVAIEEILSEVVANTGLNLSEINDRIRLKVAVASDDAEAAEMAINAAALIVSPVQRVVAPIDESGE